MYALPGGISMQEFFTPHHSSVREIFSAPAQS